MTPDFRIHADSQDITERIQDRLLSLRVTDEAGIKSDTVELNLDDRDGLVSDIVPDPSLWSLKALTHI
jgi:phage protein D